MVRPGKIFEAEIRKLLQQENALVIRIPDVLGTRFVIRKKADFVVCDSGGQFVLVEAKCTKTATFAFSRIKPHQVEALSLVASTEHGRAYLALNFRGEKSPGQAYLIPWRWFEIFTSTTWLKKSIRRAEANEEFWKFELKRITGGWIMPNVHGPRIKLI